MLVLSRKAMESLVISGKIVVQVLEVRGKKVQLGITAPETVPIQRFENSSLETAGESRSGAPKPNNTQPAPGSSSHRSKMPVGFRGAGNGDLAASEV